MSVRAAEAKPSVDVADSLANATIMEGNSFPVASRDNPLTRKFMVSIKSTLNDLSGNESKGVWAPSGETLKSMLQQRKFVSLDGKSNNFGDLKSVVLHSLTANSAMSTFPIAVGARITGVDDITFSSTGAPFSTVLLPKSEKHAKVTLQEDDVGLCYEFAAKFPGYTADNLAIKGVHEVQQRRFVLVAADHPIVSAIHENAANLQTGEISMMPEGLVKISSALYESIMPQVK